MPRPTTANATAESITNNGKERRLVLVSGYYGFANLGDEAILEELTNELKELVPADQIVVLSADPEQTSRLFGVRSLRRDDLSALAGLCRQTRLFISGGGGLFQNTRTLGSILFYSLQILMAKQLGAAVAVYAQGIGPLRGKLANWLTQLTFSRADRIAVRDNGSKALLESWQLPALLTADPVWCLQPRKLPQEIEQAIRNIPARRLVGLSLRASHNFSSQHIEALLESMLKAVPPDSHVLLLPLQMNQDAEVLEEFSQRWRTSGREATLINTEAIQYPSQWISLFSLCQVVIGMRLHALIMSLKAGVPVIGIAYDPKVSHLLETFEQPTLILTKEPPTQIWQQTMQSAFADLEKLSRLARKKAESAKKLACQNFDMLAKILDTQRT